MPGEKVLNSVRVKRTKLGITQEDLAGLVGVTRQTIIAMEQEKYSPSLELAFRIARVFNLPLEEVFTYDPKDDPI